MLKNLQTAAISKSDIIFDFDRTIAQIEIDWTDWHTGVAEIYAKYDANHGYKEGMDPHIFFNVLSSKYGQTFVDEVNQFVAKFEKENIKGFTPNTQLIEFIKSNSKNMTLHVFSSNARETVLEGLQVLGIPQEFKTLITRDDVTKVKPDIEGFLLIDTLLDNKHTFLMIGDSASDEGAAANIGIDFLRCGYFDVDI